MTWTCGKFDIDLASTRVMGIVNVTPDSFSDGGLYLRPGDAVSHARALVRDGADVIDVGAESTRPGHRPLPAAVEWARLEPVLRQLLRELPDVPVSVDTYHAETARRAVDAGAAAINCVYTPEANMWSLVEETGCGFVVPAKDYRPIGAQVLQDPMVGFGTTREEDVAILGSLRRLAARAPVLVGVSRKRVIGTLSGEAEPARRLGGSVGAAVWCAMCGASVVRVHDVKETKEALAVVGALAQQEGGAPWNGIK